MKNSKFKTKKTNSPGRYGKSSPLALAQMLSRTKLQKEQDVEMYFVPELLAMLGYRFPRDIRNAFPLESPEYNIGSQKRKVIFPDHVVYAKNRIAFVLEVKKPSLKLNKTHIGQVLSYALHPDIQAELSVLTNGRQTMVIHTRRRVPILVLEQREIPGRLPDLQLLLGRHSLVGRVGELVIDKRLGQGSFGTVYLAWNLALRRHEAIKIYHPEVLMSEASRRRFSQGLRAQARLHHACIAQIYHLHCRGSEIIASMQYSKGISYDKWIKANPSIKDKILLLSQIARAVHFAHSMGVVHRDLKPSNILVEKKGKSWSPLIVDFDTAIALDATLLTKTAESLGTLGFMAPEMSKERSSSRFSKRSPLVDIFSLGALTYYSFFGAPPGNDFTSAKSNELMKRLSGVNERQAKKLITTMIHAMDREPKSRHESAELLANDLEEALTDSIKIQLTTEQDFIEAIFSEIESLLKTKPIPGFILELYEANNQYGRVATVPNIGEAIILYDYDYRELMTGFTFPTSRKFSIFIKTAIYRKLVEIYGKKLVVHEPNPREDGGVLIFWRLSEIMNSKPKKIARNAFEILSNFREILEHERC